jgi:hypothetical protein
MQVLTPRGMVRSKAVVFRWRHASDLPNVRNIMYALCRCLSGLVVSQVVHIRWCMNCYHSKVSIRPVTYPSPLCRLHVQPLSLSQLPPVVQVWRRRAKWARGDWERRPGSTTLTSPFASRRSTCWRRPKFPRRHSTSTLNLDPRRQHK